MEKKDVINFFDNLAEGWDAEQIPKDAIIEKILDNGGVETHKDVLDIACGTGTLFPFYFERDVKSITGIDISPEMVKIAKKKFMQKNVRFICGDVETEVFERKFDCIVVYNAFPHFLEPENLIRVLASHLKEDGVLTIAHGMSREMIDYHHSGKASKVSNGLMSAEEVAKIFERYLEVTVKISDDRMYQVAGSKVVKK